MLDTINKSLTSSQLRDLEKFGGKVNKFGVNFAVCDVNGGLVLLCDGSRFKSSSEQLMEYGRRALSQNGGRTCIGKEAQVWRFGEVNRVLAAVLK